MAAQEPSGGSADPPARAAAPPVKMARAGRAELRQKHRGPRDTCKKGSLLSANLPCACEIALQASAYPGKLLIMDSWPRGPPVLYLRSFWHVFLAWLLNQLDHMHNFSNLAWVYLLCWFCMSSPLQQLLPIACQKHHHMYASASENKVGWFLVWTWEIWVSNTGALSHRKTGKNVEVADRKSSWQNVRERWKEKEPNVPMTRGYANPRFHQEVY